MTDAGGEELVGTGGFTVDPHRALAVLRERQLPDGFWRPLLWFRLASACRASRFTAEKAAFALRLAFDGDALPGTALAAPLGLLAAGGAEPRAACLGWALVHTLGEDRAVTVSSGAGADRRAFSFAADGTARAVPAAGGADTVVDIAWTPSEAISLGRHQPSEWFGWAWSKDPSLEAADAVPFRLTTPLGVVEPWETRGSDASLSASDGRRLRVSLSDGAGGLSLHHLGVRVHGEPLDDLALPVIAAVDDPALSLTASLDSPVRDDAYWKALAAGRQAAMRDLLGRLEAHAAAMRACGPLVLTSRPMRQAWARAASWPQPEPSASWIDGLLGLVPGRGGPAQAALARAASFTAYLRRAAMQTLRGPKIDSLDPLKTALWKTPAAFSATGRPLTLLEVDPPERRAPVWSESGPAPAGTAADAVWGFSAGELAFASEFPVRRAKVE